MKNSRIISAALLFTAVSALAEGDPARGKALTGACVACHQEDGNGRDNGASADAWPRLAGMNAEYLAAQLAAYKKGERRAPSMKPFSMMLDDAKAADIAAITAVRPAFRDIFFTTKTGTTIASVPGFDTNQSFINKFHIFPMGSCVID